MNKELEDALWAGDSDRLRELAPCDCCCDEHFFESCEANIWGGCRGNRDHLQNDIEGWAKHYGLTVDEFLIGDRDETET